jgi:3-phosphoshikimate 1-carboxyvinyltransferase
MSAASEAVAADWWCRPAGALHGSLRVPGDKSITQRALILGALAAGTTEIEGALDAEDCRSTANALAALGACIRASGDRTEVTAAQLRAPGAALDLGNSGTGLRLLAGLLAGQPFRTTLTGDESLRRRPMQRIAEPLERMGARIETTNGHAPVTVTGGVLRGIDYTLPVASAQVKSAILIAGLQAQGTTRVREPAASRDHTERMLPAFGCFPEVDAEGVCVRGPVRLRAAPLRVPGDFSSAAFFIVAATLIPGSTLELRDVGLNPTRTGLADLLRAMGARIELRNLREENGEPLGDLRVESAPLRGIEVDSTIVPRAIDELPVLFVAAAAASGRTRVRGAAELRVKESDRLAAMAAGLRALGAGVVEYPDGLDVDGGALSGGVVSSHGDHRLAMAFAVAAQIARGPVRIRDTANVSTSFPGFAELARSAGMGLEAAAGASE